jgi:YHS domain-containing protein
MKGFKKVLTMNESCLNCGKKQKTDEPYIIYEPEGKDYHISFCSDKCDEEFRKNKMTREFFDRKLKIECDECGSDKNLGLSETGWTFCKKCAKKMNVNLVFEDDFKIEDIKFK